MLNPPWGGSKKGCFLKNMISPPKNWVTRPDFGKILNRIQIYPAHALSRVFSLSIESFRMPHALLTDTVLGGLMSIEPKRRKTAKKVIISRLNYSFKSKSWLARLKNRLNIVQRTTNLKRKKASKFDSLHSTVYTRYALLVFANKNKRKTTQQQQLTNK